MSLGWVPSWISSLPSPPKFMSVMSQWLLHDRRHVMYPCNKAGTHTHIPSHSATSKKLSYTYCIVPNQHSLCRDRPPWGQGDQINNTDAVQPCGCRLLERAGVRLLRQERLFSTIQYVLSSAEGTASKSGFRSRFVVLVLSLDVTV